ncbi:MAG: DUF2484 family protein [Rhodobacteraceae bacterium]|nr:DUF2484 family protein [Paracoccaceae bacterium]
MTAVLAAAIWALLANMVAMLPHNMLHWNLARLLVLITPLIIWLIGRDFGVWAMLAFIVAVISLFRLPLAHMFKHLTGQLEPEK